VVRKVRRFTPLPVAVAWKLQFNEATIIAIIRVTVTTTRGKGEGASGREEAA